MGPSISPSTPFATHLADRGKVVAVRALGGSGDEGDMKEPIGWVGVRELGGACKAVFHLLHRISNGGVERGKERGSFWFGTACAVLLGVGRPWWAFTNK